MKTSRCLLVILTLAAGLAASTFSSGAMALDGNKDRRGAFAGIGLGGGAGFEDGDVAGSLMWDVQLGGGATQQLTLALDIDFWMQWYEGHRNFLITPGPEVSYFFGDTGLYLQLGIGMGLKTAISETTIIDDLKEDERHFDVGFDAGLAVGWEFFASSNVAVGLSLGADYVVIRPDNLLMVGFAMTLKYY